LLYGKPWQRGAIVLALLLFGATLLAFGNLVGVAPIAFGVLFGLRMWGPARVRASQFRRVDARTRGSIDRRSGPPTHR